MVWAVKPKSRTIDRTLKVPTILLYTQDSDELFVPNGHDQTLRDDMTPLQLTMGSFPEGSQLDIRLEQEYFIKSGRDMDDIEDLTRLTFILVAQTRTAHRTHRQILFKGAMTDQSLRHEPGTDIINITATDTAPFHRPPIDIPEGLGYNLGQYMYSFNAGWLYVWDLESDSLVVQYYTQPPMGDSSNGRNLNEIDEALINSTAITGKISFQNTQFSEVFGQMVSKQNLVPCVKYKQNGGVILTGVEKGTVERELIVRAVGISDYTEKQKENVKSWSGRRTYNTFSKLIGKGAPVETFEVLDLTKGWSSGDETTVLADLTKNKKPGQFEEVGHLYKLPKPVFNQSPKSHGWSTDNFKEDSIVILTRPKTGYPWKKYNGDWKFIATRRDGRTEGLSVDDPVDSVSPKSKKVGAIWFKDALEYGPLYTSAQQSTRAAGTPVTGDYGFCDVKIEAVVIGDPLEVTVTSEKNLPFESTKVIVDESAVKHVHTSHAEVADDGTATISTDGSSYSTRDDSTKFEERLTALLKRFEEPGHSETIELTNVDFSWWWDNVIVMVSDVTGFVCFENLTLYVEGISHDLQEMKTSITLSNTLAKSNQGAS